METGLERKQKHALTTSILYGISTIPYTNPTTIDVSSNATTTLGPQKMNVPQPSMTQQLQLPSNQNPPSPTQLLVQPFSNPNNKTTQPVFNTKMQTFPTYFIMTTPLQGVQLISLMVLQ